MSDSQADRRFRLLEEIALVPAGRDRGRSSFAGLWSYRGLLALLTRREVKVRYKDSSLGLLWNLIRPLVMLLVYYVAIGRFLGAERSIPDFAIYLFTGLTLWLLFNEVVAGGTGSIVANGGLVKKVYLPRQVFPLAVTGSSLFTFAINVVVLLAATVVIGQVPTGSRLLYAPAAITVVLLWGVGLAFMLAAVNVYLRDVQYLVEVALMVWFWTTPTVYSWTQVESAFAGNELLQQIYLANPVTIGVLAFQRAFWVAGDPAAYPEDLSLRLGIMAAAGAVLLVLALRLFRRLEGNFAQEL